jgi:hypothetical protein
MPIEENPPTASRSAAGQHHPNPLTEPKSRNAPLAPRPLQCVVRATRGRSRREAALVTKRFLYCPASLAEHQFQASLDRAMISTRGKLTRSVRNALSMLRIWDTLITESHGSLDWRLSKSTLPGAWGRRTLDVTTATITVLMRLSLKGSL